MSTNIETMNGKELLEREKRRVVLFKKLARIRVKQLAMKYAEVAELFKKLREATEQLKIALNKK